MALGLSAARVHRAASPTSEGASMSEMTVPKALACPRCKGLSSRSRAKSKASGSDDVSTADGAKRSTRIRGISARRGRLGIRESNKW